MFEFVTTPFASSGFGAIIGFIGSWVTRMEERKANDLKYKHDLEMARIRNQELKLEQDHEIAMADKNYNRAELEGEIARDIGNTEAFKMSLGSLKSTGIKWVDAITGLMRPLITLILLGLSFYLIYEINKIVGGIGSLPIDELVLLYKDVISETFFLVMVAVTWWFGSRPSSYRK